MKISNHTRGFLTTLLGVSVLVVIVLAIGSELISVSRSYPAEALIVAAILVVSAIAVFLYIGELVILGWVVDFLAELGSPKVQARPDPLVYEQFGQIIVVKLRDNIVTIQQCRWVEQQLNRLIEEHHCDFVLDFHHAEKIARSFRGVLVHLRKAARKDAIRLGKPYRRAALPGRAIFRVFESWEDAVEVMLRHDGHGWVVLSSVPVGIRAVSGLT